MAAHSRAELDALRRSLRVPLVVAPMFMVSNPRLVVAALRAGVIAAFPSINARTPQLFEEWLAEIQWERGSFTSQDRTLPPFAVNLLTHATNTRFPPDLEIVARRRPPIVITSVGPPDRVVEIVHGYGGFVFADVASLHHAKKAAAADVDGLVLLCAGAGGQTGRLNPFAFIDAVRSFFEGLLLVAGSITNGRQIRALQVAGADLGYCGTSFIGATESSSNEIYRRALIDSQIDDVWDTNAISGIPANLLRQSLDAIGLTPGDRWIAKEGKMDWSKVHWRPDLYSAGHGVGAVTKSQACAQIIEQFAIDYRAAGTQILMDSSLG